MPRIARAFGKRLVEQPLMRNVLADLALESEAALALSMRVARAVDAAPRDPREAAFARIATAIGKYWVCKRAPAFVNEAQECLGGAGYVEESMLPRLYRQAPLNSIWEGSGNIQCLDVLRALAREPDAGDGAAGPNWTPRAASHAGLRSRSSNRCAALLTSDSARRAEVAARGSLVERLALALQASLLLRAGSPMAAAFCASRLRQRHGLAFGTLPHDTGFAAILDRAMPS